MNGPGFDCPSCAVPAPALGTNVCGKCGLRYAVYPGYAADPSVVPPPPQGNVERLRVKAPGMLMMRFAALEPMGVADGDLDPLIAQAELGKNGVAYPDVVSLTLWRKRDYVDVAVGALIPLPLGFALSLAALTSVQSHQTTPALVLGVAAAFFLSGAAFLMHRGLLVQKHLARVVGRYRVLQLRFDRGPRERFRNELLRRIGLPPSDMP